jgi:hypothetical protein
MERDGDVLVAVPKPYPCSRNLAQRRRDAEKKGQVGV